MKVGVVAVGRLKQGPERELAARYAGRFGAAGKALGLGGPTIVEIAESQLRSATERRAQEGQAILAALDPDPVLIALDENGKASSSAEFAADLGRMRDSGRRAVVYAIGGADGLGDAVRAKAAAILSFGRMTMPHQLVRVMLLEQLYRAATILSGHPYHRS